ncbi:MAG: sensor histidine kinase [Leucobacter sp.]
MTASTRRWSLRTRLTVLIAAVFATGGAVLLGVQYLLVQGLFDTAIAGVASCIDDSGGIAVVSSDDLSQGEIGSDECRAILEASRVSGEVSFAPGESSPSVLIEQSTVLSQEVLSGLMLWSILTLLVFTAVAIAVASWLSRRSFARIGQITDTTKRITRQDLHQRLDLPGPADEIKELGDTIDGMLGGLEAAFTRQERFITNASHELRTPLTTTRTALEIPLEQGQVPAHLELAIRRALDANRRSEELIAALLRLARTASTNTGSPTRVELASILERSLTEHRDQIGLKQLDVATALSAASVEVGDETLLALAADNLLDNAIRHNLEHGALRVSTGMADGRAWLEIANSGAEYSREEAARLTEPFNRGRRTRTAGDGRSLGLGLTLVQNIVESLGAVLTLTPGRHGGLTARIDF